MSNNTEFIHLLNLRQNNQKIYGMKNRFKETCVCMCEPNIKSINIMISLWNDVKHIIRFNEWDTIIESITEMTGVNNLDGLRITTIDQTSEIRVRFVGTDGNYYPYTKILDILIHELAHIVYKDHNEQFYKYMDELYAQISIIKFENIHKSIYMRGYRLITDKELHKNNTQVIINELNEPRNMVTWERFKNKKVSKDDYIINILNSIVKHNNTELLNYIVNQIGFYKFNKLYTVTHKTYKYKNEIKTKLVKIECKSIEYTKLATCIICLDDVNTSNYFECVHDICRLCVECYNKDTCPVCNHSVSI